MNGPGNAIGWCDFTWNPLTGCKHGCRFGPNDTPCYAEVIAERFRGGKAFPNGFEPTYHPDRLTQPQRVAQSARVFTCSMADLFGAWNPPSQILAVLDAIRCAPQHTFELLTKAPWIAKTYDVPPNVWMGATVTGGLQRETHRLDCVREYPARVRFLSCEPLEGPIDVSRAEPDWLIIGAATGKGGYQPDEAWVAALEAYADRRGIPVYHKDNLTIRKHARRTEFPAGQTARPPAYWARAPRFQARRLALTPIGSIGV